MMKKVRLLIVDDDRFIRDLVRKTLRTQYPAFEITEAENGRKAQAILQKMSFDLVLCDWEMPEMTGIDLLRWVRMCRELQDQPFILLTSLDSKENVVQAAQAGVSDYIAKPFMCDQLCNKIMKQLVKSGVLSQDEANPRLHKEASVTLGGAELLVSKTASAHLAPIKKPRALKAILMQGNQKLGAGVQEINLREALLKVKRTEYKPELAELVQIGLLGGSTDAPETLTVKAFITSIQLAQINPKTEHLLVRVHFLKQEPDTLATLKRLLG